MRPLPVVDAVHRGCPPRVVVIGTARAARGATGSSYWSRYSLTARRSWRATGTPVRSRIRASRRASTFGTSHRYMWAHLPSLLVTTQTRPDQIEASGASRDGTREIGTP